MLLEVGGGNTSTIKVWDGKEGEIRRNSRIAELSSKWEGRVYCFKCAKYRKVVQRKLQDRKKRNPGFDGHWHTAIITTILSSLETKYYQTLEILEEHLIQKKSGESKEDQHSGISSLMFTPDFRLETLRHGKRMERPGQIKYHKEEM